MKNLHLIEVKYLGATDTKGNRIKLISHRFNESITLNRDYVTNSGNDQAKAYLKKQGQKIIGQAEGLGDSDYIMLDAVNDEGFKRIK